MSAKCASSLRLPVAHAALVLLLCMRCGMVGAEELAADPARNIVVGSCTACHSANLITQNRMNRSGWKKTIRWMQQYHGLWDLGESETVVLDYLSTYYNVPEILGGRRIPLNQPPLGEAGET